METANNKHLTRMCALCPNMIPPHMFTCRQCWKTFKSYEKEPWMHELIRMERKQALINNYECGSNIPETNPILSREKSLKDIVLDLYFNSGLTTKEISIRLQRKYSTIRQIVLRHKKNPRDMLHK